MKKNPIFMFAIGFVFGSIIFYSLLSSQKKHTAALQAEINEVSETVDSCRRAKNQYRAKLNKTQVELAEMGQYLVQVFNDLKNIEDIANFSAAYSGLELKTLPWISKLTDSKFFYEKPKSLFAQNSDKKTIKKSNLNSLNKNKSKSIKTKKNIDSESNSLKASLKKSKSIKKLEPVKIKPIEKNNEEQLAKKLAPVPTSANSRILRNASEVISKTKKRIEDLSEGASDESFLEGETGANFRKIVRMTTKLEANVLKNFIGEFEGSVEMPADFESDSDIDSQDYFSDSDLSLNVNIEGDGSNPSSPKFRGLSVKINSLGSLDTVTSVTSASITENVDFLSQKIKGVKNLPSIIIKLDKGNGFLQLYNNEKSPDKLLGAVYTSKFEKVGNVIMNKK